MSFKGAFKILKVIGFVLVKNTKDVISDITFNEKTGEEIKLPFG